MSGIASLGYLGLGISNLGAWRDYAENLLGLQYAGQSDDGAHLYRMDEYSRRFLLYEDPADDIIFAGFEVADAQALDNLTKRLEKASVAWSQGSKAECEARAVMGFISLEDPDGLQVEIYYGAKKTFEKPFHAGRPMSGFLTGEQGMGHIVLTTADLDRSVNFYQSLLHFRISDYITITLSPEMRADFVFMRCNPRHHSLALAPLPLPKRLQHIMLQAESLDDVGFAYDLARQRGEKITIELGRHSNDHMVSFYMTAPSGFDVEYGWGARTVDEKTWRVERHDTPSIWGHKQIP